MLTALPDPPAELGLVRDELLARHTYLRIGGPAAWFGAPTELEALERISAWAREVDLPLRVIGGGSNVLVADEGIRAVVVSLRRACAGVEWMSGASSTGPGTGVRVGAAVMLPSLARAAAERDHGGLEFGIGIPGSIGGALQSNAGIGDGRCIGDLVRSVDVLRDGERVTLSRKEIGFQYRETSLRGSGDVVLCATLALTPRPRAEAEAEMRQLLEARQRTQPTAERNAGSIFRNPPGDFAGRLIEAAGCKGMRSGAAQVSELHANFIVHGGKATAAEVAELMAQVQAQVAERFGVRLVPEVEWWGDGPPPVVFRDASDAPSERA